MKHGIKHFITFYHVVELNSFSKAAHELNLSKAHVSNLIKQLEQSIQTKLLERNTRNLELTFAGEQLFTHCKKMVAEYQNAEQTLSTLQNKPQGLLRVTAPSAYAAHVLSNALPAFFQQYPEIAVDMSLTGEVLDLLTQKMDVAIRLTHTPPPDRIAKLIGYYQLQVCASVDYLKSHSEINHPQQLAEHPCLVYSTEVVSERWPFMIGEKLHHVYVNSRLASNQYENILFAVKSGVGIARLPSYVIDQALKEGELKLLFQEYEPARIPIYVIYAQNIIIPPRVRVFVEFLQTLDH